MTKVCIERSGSRTLIKAEGHATGSPEVCAAVSALLSALDAYVRYAEEEMGARVYRREVESGRVLLDFSGGAEVQGAAAAAELGLALLQGSYGEYVSVETKEGWRCSAEPMPEGKARRVVAPHKEGQGRRAHDVRPYGR